MARTERPLRPWSWARIDGRNVFAVPTQSEIRVYDSVDFILLHRLAPSGHRAPVALVRWSAFHGKLASLSAAQIMVHAPQRDPASRTRVSFVPIVDFRLGEARVAIRGLAFSRCADELLFCGRHVGVGKLDVRARAQDAYGGFCEDEPGDGRMLWEQRSAACDVAKFSPSAFVFATLKIRHSSVQVWRMARCSRGPEASSALYDPCERQDGPQQTVARVEELAHPDPVVYFSWKPSTTQWVSAHESDGTRKAQWFEPARILLTCTTTRTIRIWTENADKEADGHMPCFTPVLLFEPPHPIDNFRWVLSKNRNISDESFRVVDDSKDQHTDWISGVDQHGILRLWRVVGIVSLTPSVEETSLRIKVNGEDDSQRGGGTAKPRKKPLVRLGEVCVMAYFSQNYFGMPSKFDIVLQRADHIILSLDVAVGGGGDPPCIKKKSWYRSHLGAISALSAHPSLPLIASVDAHPSENDDCSSAHEILVFWISFSAFSAESRLIPSGVLSCTDDINDGNDGAAKKDCGPVLCVQWVPTLHFDATPLLLVAFKSGLVSVYGRSADAAGVVSSPLQPLPAQRQRLLRSPSLSPWTFYDYTTGESRAEYEIAPVKPATSELGVQLEGKDGKLLVSRVNSSDQFIKQVVPGDELVGINNKSVVGKDPEEVLTLIDLLPPENTMLMRFRAASVLSRQESTERSSSTEEPRTENSADSEQPTPSDGRLGPASSIPFILKYSSGGANDKSSATEASDQQVEESAAELRRGLVPMLEDQGSLSPRDSDNVVHAGSVSTYGGWQQLLRVKAAASLSSLCCCPAYADDGEYIPDAVVIFGITSLPGKLCAWKGIRGSVSHSFELASLQIRDASIERKCDITSIAGERDYRQRAFTSKRVEGHDGLNSLLFIGDATGDIEHWRCHISGDGISFTMMSSCQVSQRRSPVPPLGNAEGTLNSPVSFCRRGYVSTDQAEGTGASTTATVWPLGVRHIEVDDPNRVAVLHAERPDELHVFEGESGLGILRLEEFIPSSGRGNVLGFSWCNSHVEFNVDALAVRYESAMVIYQYDMNLHRWAQIGEDIVSPLSIFDCTRDSSALLIGGGYVQAANSNEASAKHRFAISNEMPVVMGKWDEPGSLLQYSMDWKAAESPQKLPVWHPYVILTTLFGMHARVGEKDTSLAGDEPTYEFSRAFKDAIQMLKLLAKVIEDDMSAHASARSGVLAYTATGPTRADTDTDTDTDTTDGVDFGLSRSGAPDPIGRYSTSVHRSADVDKAENLFAMPTRTSQSYQRGFDFLAEREAAETTANELQSMTPAEVVIVQTAIDTLLLGKAHAVAANAAVLFTSFSEEHLLEMKAILRYVEAIQALGFDLDASPADLGAKRFFSMDVFAKSLKRVMMEHGSSGASDGSSSLQVAACGNSLSNEAEESSSWCPSLGETPSSGFLWALHSDAQQFLWEHCIRSEMSWEDLRPMWLGLWVKDVKDLRGIVERCAKLSYTRTKDAMSICLYYVALGKKNVLSALAKFSRSDRNKTLASFLENDFSQERWSNAAVRNAYSLLGKQHYEEAAAFFLLCDPPRIQEAVRVLAVRLADPSLALVIARLVEYRTSDSFRYDFISTAAQSEITPAGAVTKELLRQDVVPLFRRKRDKWLESCALWWLEDFEQACAALLPQSQEVDVYGDEHGPTCESDDLATSAARATHFYVNLTSITIYFQYLHSSVNSPMLSWAMKKMQQQASHDTLLSPHASSKRRHQLASHADIEHAFSFAAYVCKRSGLSDTALVEMLQARHLVNIHARFEISAIESTSDRNNGLLDKEQELNFAEQPTSPRFRPSLKTHWRTASDLSIVTSSSSSPDRAALGASPRRRMSDLNESLSLLNIDLAAKDAKPSPLRRASTANWSKLLQSEKAIPSAPWLKAQIADIECRRWASSAFVGKMIGIRVAREMISHFRVELDLWFRHGEDDDSEAVTSTITAVANPTQRRHRRSKLHKDFLSELCAPLCEQFQVDRKYVYEAALAVMHPHAYLHIVEVCFLLSELKRASTLRKWIQYVSLSMLHSCSTFASCSITEDVYRDWEGLTIQLCYILNLDAEGQISISPLVVAYINVAVRTGTIFLGWARQRSDLVREAVSLPFNTQCASDDSSSGTPFSSLSSFAFEKNVGLIRNLERGIDTSRSTRKRRNSQSFVKSFGFTFLGTVASHVLEEENISLLSWGGMDKSANHHQFKIRKMYTLILMVSVLRTMYARATLFLGTFQGIREEEEKDEGEGELDISSSLFTPRKLWKALGEGPLDGIKRWYALIESHLRCEFDYSVKEVQCLCGLYGLDNAALERSSVSSTNGKLVLPREGPSASDDEDFGDWSEQEVGHGDTKIRAEHSTAFEDTCGQREVERADTLEGFLHDIGMNRELHSAMVKSSDDYVLLLMQSAGFGVQMTQRRFRADPRVYTKSFLLGDAFDWFKRHGIFPSGSDGNEDDNEEGVVKGHAFLTRCCKHRKLRLLVAHRGEDAQMFPLDPHVTSSRSHSHSNASEVNLLAGVECKLGSHKVPDALRHQAMMFVDPWEVEAEWNVRRYMHNMEMPLHVELGWDRLSPICLETCDDIIESVFADPDLVAMWKATGGEGWLVTAITQYQLDGVHSYRTHHQYKRLGLDVKNEPRIPFLVEAHSRAQRNAMFQEAGLPHRFVGVVTVELVEAKELISCGWLTQWSNAYVFLELVHPEEKARETAEEWSLQTYRSKVGEGGVNPRWSAFDNKFPFRFAIPTHSAHVHSSQGAHSGGAADRTARRAATQLWDARITESNRTSVDALDALIPSVFSGPPTVLRCSVYQKNKVLSHQFMGRGEVSLHALTSGSPMDCWLPLEDTASGSVHVRIALSFPLMCSFTAGKHELEDLR